MIAACEVNVRPAEDRDIEEIVLLDASLQTLPHWPAAAYRAVVGGASGSPLRCFYVAEWNGQIVGMAVARIDWIAEESFAELETVGVAVASQRQGVGGELCRAIITWCRSQGATHIDLEVRSRSAGAILLYRSLGFVDVGRRGNYYRDPADDAMLMRLVLTADPTQPAVSTESAA